MTIHSLHGIWNSQPGDLAGIELTGVVTRIHSMDGHALKPAGAPRRVAVPRRAPEDDFIGALGHGLALLECWSAPDVWLSNSELVARSGLTKSTVSRLASVLTGLGYLAREGQRGRLRLTSATLELGFGSPFALESVAGLHPDLTRLAKDLDVYAALGIRRADKVQVLANVASPLHPDAVAMDVGGLLPICRSACGLAALSALPEEDAQPLMERLRLHYGSRWQPLQRQLVRTKEEYSSLGYCTSIAGLSRDVAAVAVPIFHPGSADMYVIGCGMPATEYHRARVENEIVPQMLEVARGLAASI